MLSTTTGKFLDISKSNAAKLSDLILSLERSLRRSYHASKVTPARLSAMYTISSIPRCTIGQLAQAEQVTAPTITGIVDSLVKTNQITREADTTDRRISRLALTELGLTALDDWHKWRADRLSQKLESSGLTEHEIARTIEILAKL